MRVEGFLEGEAVAQHATRNKAPQIRVDGLRAVGGGARSPPQARQAERERVDGSRGELLEVLGGAPR